jgi:hypothetical protein
MAGSRTLKLSILGDVDNLNKSLKTATADVETFGDKMGKVGKAVGAAFAAAAVAAGAYAIKIGVDGVKAALEDEKAQRILALTLENTTKATNAQIAAVESYITEVALATGVTDDQLRPALSRLVRSTKDTEEAQKLLSLALDISSATGKPLEAIANSLGKAYDGNTNALGKLGLGIDQSILKTKDFNKVYESLRTSFAGFSAQEAQTFQGRIDRLNVAFDEAKETVGFALLPVLERLISFINDNALPILNAFSKAFSSDENGVGGVITNLGKIITNVFTPIINGLVKAFNYVKDAIGDNLETFKEFGGYIATYLAPVIGTVLGGALQVAGKIAGTVIDVIGGVIKVLNGLISGAITGINALISAYNFANNIFGGKDIAKINAPTISIPSSTATSSGGSSKTPTIPSIPSISSIPSGGGTSSGGTSTSGGAVATITKKAAEAITNVAGAFDNFTSGTTTLAGIEAASNRPFAFGTSGVNTNTLAGILAASAAPTINVTVNGAIDREGTARTIVDTLNNSFYRGTGGATNLQIA